MINSPKSKSEVAVQLQYGGHLFPKPDVVISQPLVEISKSDLQIDLALLKPMPSLNPNPEVDLRRHGRHFENSIRRHNSAVGGLYDIW